MNILVLLKLVSIQRFADTLGEPGERLTSGDPEWNPPDIYALELALRIKDAEPETVVTAITMAPRSYDRELRYTVAMGADKSILIADRRLAGSDTLATAHTLAAAIQKLPQQDLILCGKKSMDSETGHIGPQVAALLDLPLAVNVTDFSVQDGLAVKCLREGSVRTIRGRFPSLLTVCPGSETVRRPTLEGIRRSRGTEIRIMDLHNLGVPESEVGIMGSATRVVSVQNIEFGKKHGTVVKNADEGVALIAAALRKYGSASV